MQSVFYFLNMRIIVLLNGTFQKYISSYYICNTYDMMLYIFNDFYEDIIPDI